MESTCSRCERKFDSHNEGRIIQGNPYCGECLKDNEIAVDIIFDYFDKILKKNNIKVDQDNGEISFKGNDNLNNDRAFATEMYNHVLESLMNSLGFKFGVDNSGDFGYFEKEE